MPHSKTPSAPTPETSAVHPFTEDPYLWLEDVAGERPLAWVRQRNSESLNVLATERQRALEQRLEAIYDSKQQIPLVTKRGPHLYNFWRDHSNPRGLWRRTTLAEYAKLAPSWETLLDIDQLAKSEQENWVFKGSTCLRPAYQRCLVSLSRGGADAVVVREFDIAHKRFVPEGFFIPEAKSRVSWQDEHTLLVGSDFGPGTLTDAGYPRMAKQWRRGTPLPSAKLLFEGQHSDVAVTAVRDWHQGRSIDFVQRSTSFFENELFLLRADGKTERIPKPNDAEASFFQDFLLLQLRSDWTEGTRTWPAGALLAAPLQGVRAGLPAYQLVFEPANHRSLTSFSGTKNSLLMNVLENVRSKLWIAHFESGHWRKREVDLGTLEHHQAWALDDEESDRYWLSANDFTSPERLELGDSTTERREVLRETPAFFSAEGLETLQFFATSKDGTKIPYYQVARKDLAFDANNPVLLSGYGGFEVSLTAHYDPTVGAAWLERGGVLVQANLRGGGEYGPAWHQAARKHDRQRAYDDFIAVAEDLIRRKVTRPRKLGIVGRSNGGLLVGVMLTQRPDLWGAVVCSVPLLDMKRYHRLLAGASWMEEYGNPDDPEDWAAIARYSPYQRVQIGTRYPRVFFTTSTRDDRVHPGHARKMVARLIERGQEVLYFENIEGGHAGAADNAQRAKLSALEYEYLYQQLMD